ncbi:MAG: hypothetical protein EOM92_15170 [Gammaproteobacteria bacterium]|nr:hypothetical protein [Gammaproteobacteria bacterium]
MMLGDGAETEAIEAFVEQQFGGDAVIQLRSIRTGGDNNQKGGVYENFFAVAKICEIVASEDNLADFTLSAQEFSYVDDLCLRQRSNNTKTNYQAKNSSGDAARWTPTHAERFARQTVIDRDFHRVDTSNQVLVVSCPSMAEANRHKISQCGRASFRCEYFPYFPASVQLIFGEDTVRENLKVICGSDDVSTANAVFTLLLGVWHSAQAAARLDDLVRQARHISKPDLFLGLDPTPGPPPPWLTGLCSQYAGLELHIEAGRYVVTYRGLSIAMKVEIEAQMPAALATAQTLNQVLSYLMLQAAPELAN